LQPKKNQKYLLRYFGVEIQNKAANDYQMSLPYTPPKKKYNNFFVFAAGLKSAPA